MGSSGSKAAPGWRPSPEGGAAERRLSKAGYDITPLMQSDIKRLAASLTPFQR